MMEYTKQPVVIQISRMEIARCDPFRVLRILASFVPDLSERNRNRVEFEVLGYLEDPRELYDIPQVRAYFYRLFTEHKGLFYWVSLEGHMFMFLALLLYSPVRVDGFVTVSSVDLQSYLMTGFASLNEFCREFQLSPDLTNQAINRWVRQ